VPIPRHSPKPPARPRQSMQQLLLGVSVADLKCADAVQVAAPADEARPAVQLSPEPTAQRMPRHPETPAHLQPRASQPAGRRLQKQAPLAEAGRHPHRLPAAPRSTPAATPPLPPRSCRGARPCALSPCPSPCRSAPRPPVDVLGILRIRCVLSILGLMCGSVQKWVQPVGFTSQMHQAVDIAGSTYAT